MSESATYSYLIEHGVKPSVQRLAVMEFLNTHHTHPTADEIYCALIGKIPTLSKTTVYNTLKLLVEHGVAHMLTIDERNVCFDGILKPHAHCLCTKCGKIFDVELNNKKVLEAERLPNGFEVDNVELYFRGICKECRRAEGKNEASVN